MSLPDVSRRTTLGFLQSLFLPVRPVQAAIPNAAGMVCSSLQALRACDIERRSVLLAGIPDVPDGTVNWISGDYRATPAYRLDRDVFGSDMAPLATGAWVRQGIDTLPFVQAGSGAQPRTLEDKAREIVSVFDFGAKGDGVTNDTAAFDAAIATGKTVSVPYTTAGYIVTRIRVVNNMQVVGEKQGMALAPILIVNQPNSAAFYNDSRDNVFHCVFENLACRAAPGVAGTSFYAQATDTKYSGYFTFRQIETYRSLRTSYRGLFIFALWDRCRDGYLGTVIGGEHAAIVAMAGSYGQTNQQNLNRIRDSMFFGAVGGTAAIAASFGILWTIDNTNFEALRTQAFACFNLFQVRFSNCWFEDITAPSIVHAGNYPATNAASGVTFDHCNFVLTGQAPEIVTIDPPGTAAFVGNQFNLIGNGVRLSASGAWITINDNNMAVSGDGMASFFAGTHPDRYHDGRRAINGANDNRVAGMTFQNEGGLSATDGFLSHVDILVGSAFVTVARSLTGLGGTCIVSGYDPKGGAQIRVIKDWQGGTVRDVVAPLNATGKMMTFRTVGQELQMKVDTGSLTVFTTMLH